MNCKDLEKEFISLGEEAGNFLLSIMHSFNRKNNVYSHEIGDLDWNPFNELPNGLLLKINNTFLKLIEMSHNEDYYFRGCSYEVFIKTIEIKKKNYVNPVLGKTEQCYYEKIIKNISEIDNLIRPPKPFYTLEHILKKYPSENWVYSFLNNSNIEILKRNYNEVFKYLKYKIETLENLNYTINDTASTKKTTPTITKPKINLRLWNEDCYNLLFHLYEMYCWGEKTVIFKVNRKADLPHGFIKKITNIYNYFNGSFKKQEDSKYQFRASKKEFIKFIKNEFNLNIEKNNFEKSGNWIEQLDIMKEYTESFETSKDI